MEVKRFSEEAKIATLATIGGAIVVASGFMIESPDTDVQNLTPLTAVIGCAFMAPAIEPVTRAVLNKVESRKPVSPADLPGQRQPSQSQGAETSQTKVG